MFDINSLLRPHLRNLTPYSSARDEFSGTAQVYLDANENSFGSATAEDFNRYPDPHQRRVKRMLARLKEVPADQIFLGNGSDEPIDLLIRAFCQPGQDHILILPPTYGMYSVSATINGVGVREVLLRPNFSLDANAVLSNTDRNSKILFICSPNNPTGNLMDRVAVEKLLQEFPGLVVVDEAYIDYCREDSWTCRLEEFPNLVVLQTFSKAWGLAALRLGMAFASRELIEILNKIKPPYNISQLSQQYALRAITNRDKMKRQLALTLFERQQLEQRLPQLAIVEKVYPSEANFLLVKVQEARPLYDFLLEKGIVVRDRSRVQLCEGCLRITVGTPNENEQLLEALAAFSVKEKQAI
ncbi:histidinol-phosphate transaminase [Cesiribacter andamanensis]|uniref:Histidinol-phosphate aminotransferase n=1 Tax=Cesiribacter andamanensis AMV16 TaxID=1279009 RepID=M7P2R1_9BACT|nr:histidinol-phosphate transaminase [Cesiribacter andamanensis]EMR04839.1 Histidinol-phosphate aminotransferase [Cesiribacter andamanensis AMV16]